MQEAEEHLSQLSKSNQLRALKAQLRFRKHVIQQKYPDKVYNFSDKSTGTYSLEKLRSNLLHLLEAAATQTTEVLPENAQAAYVILNGKCVIHQFNDDGETRGYTGRVVSQVPGFPSWYNIVYDEGDTIYTFQLMEDYCNGDLEIT